MRPFLVILLIAAHSWTAMSQPQDEAEPFAKAGFIPGTFIMMEPDMLGNVYAVTTGGHLKKYNAEGDSLAVWNNARTWGMPGSVDAANPMRILLFYPTYLNIAILDKLLVPRSDINLRKENLFKVSAIANAYDNNIWVFDQQDFKIKKVSENGSVISESTDLRMLFSQPVSPRSLVDSHNSLYLYDPDRGVYIFDYYGSFKVNIPVTGLDFFGITGDWMYGISENRLLLVNQETRRELRFVIPGGGSRPEDLKCRNGMLYMLTKKGIDIRKMKIQ